MKKNRQIRLRLEKIYGKGCMFQKACIAERIEAMGGIKTYKQFLSERRYTFAKIRELESTMSLHHLKHRAEGGESSEYNGSVINCMAHAYSHSLPREHEEIVNNMLREYKKCKIELVDNLELDVQVNATIVEIPLKRTKEFNRAAVKRETRKLIMEEDTWEKTV